MCKVRVRVCFGSEVTPEWPNQMGPSGVTFKNVARMFPIWEQTYPEKRPVHVHLIIVVKSDGGLSFFFLLEIKSYWC